MVKTANLNTDVAASPSTVADLNADLTAHIALSTEALSWQASPSPGVMRKRLYRAGPHEAGRVTSIVRYDAGATFPSHEHPEGEEILVLSGVFSDEHGDWPAGTYLLNPEGYRHKPWSEEGCTLFVRLRQHPGLERSGVRILQAARQWQDLSRLPAGIRRCSLSEGTSIAGIGHDIKPDRSLLLHCANPADLAEQWLTHDLELFIITGGVEIAGQHWPAGSWLRWPAGHAVKVTGGDSSLFYARTSGFQHLGK